VTSEELLNAVKRAVLALEPSATLFLYGSRARGDGRDDSDWDFLIVLPGDVTQPRKRRIRRALYEIEWETGHVLTSLVTSSKEWKGLAGLGAPICGAVEKEGIAL